jgi:hypothetical protein
MPPVWTDLATAAGLVRDGDLVALGGQTRYRPHGYPGYFPQDAAHIFLYLKSSENQAMFDIYLKEHVMGRAF